MRITIIEYETDAGVFTDTFTESEEIPDYGDDLLSKAIVEISEAKIEKLTKELLKDHSFYVKIIEKNSGEKLKEGLYHLGYDLINNKVYRGDFQKLCHEEAKKEAIRELIDESRQETNQED